MSSFGSRRKARVIKVSDDGDDAPERVASDQDAPKPVFASRAGRKPVRQSSLRKTANDDDAAHKSADEDEDEGPAVVRPNIARSSSSQKKRMPLKSKLSSGRRSGDDDDVGEDAITRPPKKTPLGKRAMENSASKKGVSALPMRTFHNDDDDDRPKYSKEYLEELQSSTPNTPRPVSAAAADMMELDESELDGALVVDDAGIGSLAPATTATTNATQVLTEAQIREKKERRVRLAREQDFLSVEDDDDDDAAAAARKPAGESRLKASEDEMGEGFDSYIEDGGLSLGRRAERERRKRDRQQMAELITAAEGNPDESSSDSDDAERRIAYEAAQTRAGMEGLDRKLRKDGHSADKHLLKVPAKMAPIPSLPECIAKLQLSLRTMEAELHAKEAHLQKLRDDKAAIAEREVKVQSLLDDTGKKYQEAMAQGKVHDGTTTTTTTAAASVSSAEMLGERGLESIGATPQREGSAGDQGE
ncbi:hypothetical protein GMORB2_3854 [Geosmithia morbida]|uniref:Nineteen complex-related protein 2-domain-containing protein n=1 Tax=Geosmithia morbida TaxID=1094350 RepID=A0A9P5D6Q8_9HYPO|nr:uncharacterized protein GMORB2_3854 [Geosmithia morbida]KAF4125015.1 hypothetical protein GMORB2_3854 [Geosmithia morbida]